MSRKTKSVTVIEVDESAVVVEDYMGNKNWLMGIDRPSNVKVGDTGILEYKTGPSFGLWFFTPDTK